MKKINKTKTAIAVGAALVLSAGAADANVWDFNGGFDMYAAGADAGAAPSHEDATTAGSFDLDNATGSFTSPTPFFGYNWSADVDTMFQYDTTYAGFDMMDPTTWTAQAHNYTGTVWTMLNFGTGASSKCTEGVVLEGCSALVADGFVKFGTPTVASYDFNLTAPGMFAAGVFFDWSTTQDIPVLAVMQGIDDPSDGVFDVVGVDSDGDGNPGHAMITDPFPGQSPAFWGTMTCTDCAPAVPVPAAVWLFGSGLLGLVGVARRKTKV